MTPVRLVTDISVAGDDSRCVSCTQACGQLLLRMSFEQWDDE